MILKYGMAEPAASCFVLCCGNVPAIGGKPGFPKGCLYPSYKEMSKTEAERAAGAFISDISNTGYFKGADSIIK